MKLIDLLTGLPLTTIASVVRSKTVPQLAAYFTSWTQSAEFGAFCAMHEIVTEARRQPLVTVRTHDYEWQALAYNSLLETRRARGSAARLSPPPLSSV